MKSENFDDLIDVVLNFGSRNAEYEVYGRRSTSGYNDYQYNYQLADVYKVYENQKTYYFTKMKDYKGINSDYLDVFLLSKKYFIKLSIGEYGVLHRVQQIWKQDVKKIDIFQSTKVEIYFHGYYDPETLVLESYEKALELQRKLMDLRELY